VFVTVSIKQGQVGGLNGSACVSCTFLLVETLRALFNQSTVLQASWLSCCFGECISLLGALGPALAHITNTLVWWTGFPVCMLGYCFCGAVTMPLVGDCFSRASLGMH
jgi:hypothetical protein